MEDNSVRGKVTVITGAGRGLGEALAEGFAAEGAIVCPWDIQEPLLRGVADTLRASGRLGRSAVVDVTDEAAVCAEIDRIVAELGRLDIMVANAGILRAFEISEFPADQWRRIIEVDLTGYFLCAKHAARVMKQQQSGVIIQINSKSGKKGSYKNCAYAAAKFGGIGLTQSIALDLAPYGIRVNAVCPGNLLDSPLWKESLFDEYARKWGIPVEEVKKKYIEQVPLRRPCTYQDVLNVVLFLAGDRAGYMTGQAINVTGGQEMR